VPRAADAQQLVRRKLEKVVGDVRQVQPVPRAPPRRQLRGGSEAGSAVFGACGAARHGSAGVGGAPTQLQRAPTREHACRRRRARTHAHTKKHTWNTKLSPDP
jgi:hypothetical protein